MRYYETLYILNPDYEKERVDSIMKDVDEQVSKFSQVIAHSVWGKKRLAYPIDKHKYGTYVLFQFETEDQNALGDFDSFMKLNNSVLRFQNVRLDAKPEVIENDFLDESTERIEQEFQVKNMRGIPEETPKAPVEEKFEDTDEASETAEEETSV
ncbi:MAG TPA: 30S ribosomal protein S6 [Candidatus Marinimicrobia bacterium]|nr:30S ribosomal protein S6 [Candidatus Neomarinimicrobiota bacterium]